MSESKQSNNCKTPTKWYQDSKGNTSSGRIMSMVALWGGLIIMALLATGNACELAEFDLALAALFGGALGGKAAQSWAESKS